MEHQAKKRALVLCDNNLLFDVIKLNLEKVCVTVTRCEREASANRIEEQREVDDFDLIVVAISSSTGEPVVTLFNASLTEQIGHIPLLIISDRKFDPNYEGQIFHLAFPFDANELRRKVQTVLEHQIPLDQ